MNRFIVRNATSQRVQVCVRLANLVSNFQLNAGDQDDNTRVDAGESVEFWWRDDGNPCIQCEDGGADCALNEVQMPDADFTVVLGDAQWAQQTR